MILIKQTIKTSQAFIYNIHTKNLMTFIINVLVQYKNDLYMLINIKIRNIFLDVHREYRELTAVNAQYHKYLPITRLFL